MYIIKNEYDNLSRINKLIAEYILKKPSEVIWFSAKEFANEISVSQASITRFCQLIGFEGFSELKIVLSQQITKYGNNTLYEFDSEDLKNDIVGNLLYQATCALKDTAAMLSREKITAAAKLMFNSEKIMCSGIGASDLIAQDLMHKLLRIQKDAVVFPDNDLRKIALSQFTSKDLLIAVSYSGKKRETMELATMAALQGVPVLALTGVGSTPLSRIAKLTLEAAAFESEYRPSALSSRTATLFIVDVLFYTYSLFFTDKPSEKLRATYNIINMK